MEQLFRGKSKDYDNWWIYGDLRHISDGLGGYTLNIVDNTNGRNNDVTGIEIIPSTLGRYSGFSDKNKHAAYEGDVIKHLNGLDYGIIRYGSYSNSYTSAGFNIGFYVEWVLGENKETLRQDLGYWLSAETAEIIGAVSDDPPPIPFRKECLK